MKKGKEIIKKMESFLKKNKTIQISVLTGIILAVIWAVIHTKYVDYNPINGDFQNYNSVRRLLEGQVPFRDFSVYLGCGQLYLEAFILYIVGNTFKNSLFAMYFLSVICFWITMIILIFIVTESKEQSLYVSNFLLFLNLYRPAFFVNFILSDLGIGFNLGLEPGNSARLIRGFVVILLAVLFLQLKKVAWNNKRIEKMTAGIAFLSGVFLLWSNDYGVTASISIAAVYAVSILKFLWKKWKKLIKQAGIYIVMYLFGMISSVLLVTKLNIKNWFAFMLGVGKYQQWYYDRSPLQKTYYIYEWNVSIWSVLVLLLIVYYLIQIIKIPFSSDNQNSFIRNAVLLYIFLAVFLGTNFYHLLSGGVSEEMVQIVLIGYGTGQLAKLLRKLDQKGMIKVGVAVNLLLASYGLASLYSYQIDKNKISNGYQYIGGKIDGYLNPLEAESLKTVEEKLDGKTFFSTYASAAEVYLNTFQPTQYDYIIHVLGDQSRIKYLDIFKKGQYEYAATIREDYTLWEYWIKNANWFFYRQLYAEYIPNFLTGYQVYWKKGNVNTYQEIPNFKIDYIDNKIKIILEYEEPIHAVADIRLTYNTKYIQPFYKTGAFKKMVYISSDSQKLILPEIEKEYADFFIPEKSDLYYIPVTIVDGYGEVTLEGVPFNQVVIDLKDAAVENTFYLYENLGKVYDLTDENWENGVSRTEKKLLFYNIEKTYEILQHAKYLQSNTGEMFEIQSIEAVDSYFIWVILNTDCSIEHLKSPNDIFAVR